MTNAKPQILVELEAYAEKVGLTPSTVCYYATKNARLPERLAKRIATLERDEAALRRYMAENRVTAEETE